LREFATVKTNNFLFIRAQIELLSPNVAVYIAVLEEVPILTVKT